MAFAGCEDFYNELNFQLKSSLEKSEESEIIFEFQSSEFNTPTISKKFADRLLELGINDVVVSHRSMKVDPQSRHYSYPDLMGGGGQVINPSSEEIIKSIPTSRVEVIVSSPRQLYDLYQIYTDLGVIAQRVKTKEKVIRSASLEDSNYKWHSKAYEMINRNQSASIMITFKSSQYNPVRVGLEFQERVNRSLMFKNIKSFVDSNDGGLSSRISLDLFKKSQLVKLDKLFFELGYAPYEIQVIEKEIEPAVITQESIIESVNNYLNDFREKTPEMHFATLSYFLMTLNKPKFKENPLGYLSYLKFEQSEHHGVKHTVSMILDMYRQKGELGILANTPVDTSWAHKMSYSLFLNQSPSVTMIFKKRAKGSINAIINATKDSLNMFFGITKTTLNVKYYKAQPYGELSFQLTTQKQLEFMMKLRDEHNVQARVNQSKTN